MRSMGDVLGLSDVQCLLVVLAVLRVVTDWLHAELSAPLHHDISVLARSD
jgi:hypothetical protein